MTQCSSHIMFEKMIERGLDALGGRLEGISTALSSQTEALKSTLDHLIETQAAMRESSAVRAEQVAALQESDEAQWSRINSNSAKLNWLLGLVAVAQLILIGICTALYRHLV